MRGDIVELIADSWGRPARLRDLLLSDIPHPEPYTPPPAPAPSRGPHGVRKVQRAAAKRRRVQAQKKREKGRR